MASYDIHTMRGRERLKRKHRCNDPFWRPVGRGRAIGYDPWRETWHARIRPESGGKKYETHALGKLPSWDEAVTAAEAWFKLKAEGVNTDEVKTVAAACAFYVKEQCKRKGEASGHDALMRFQRTVYDTSLGTAPLVKPNIVRVRMKERFEDLDLAPASARRTLTAVKAALHLAIDEGYAPSQLREELRRVKAPEVPDNRRTLYLDRQQRHALLDAATGALHDLMQAVMLTGCRAGELVSTTRSQFDARTGTLRVSGKTRARAISLVPAAVALFERLAKSKLPAARLLVRDDAQPWAHSDWDELVREAAERAGLPKGTCLYTLRHSFITQWLSDGMRTLDVARMVGTSVMMIEKHYGHLVADAARERLAKVALL